MKKTNIKNLAHVLLETTDGKSEADSKRAVKEFARYLEKNRLLKEANNIFEYYRMLYNRKHNITEATVTLVNRLPEKMRLHLREALKKKYKAREVHILEKVDERIIGGMKVQVDDTLYDSSLKNTLDQLQATLAK